MASPNVDPSSKAMNLDGALEEGFASAYDWYLQWQEVKAYDEQHPEKPSNAELVARTSRPVGDLALHG